MFLGYRHSGTEMYIDRLGRLKDVKGWRRVSDRLQGFLSGLKRFKVDQLSDHSAPNYIDSIFKIVRAKDPKPPTDSSAKGNQEQLEIQSAGTEKQLTA